MQVGPFRDEVRPEDVAAGVLDQHLRVEFPLVLHDRESLDAAGGVLLAAEGFAFLEVLVPDLAALLAHDRDRVRVPPAEDRAGVDLLALDDQQLGPVRHRVPFDDLAVLRA